MTFTPTPPGPEVDELRARGFTGEFAIDVDAIPPAIRCRTCGRSQFPEHAVIIAALPVPPQGSPTAVLGLRCPRCTAEGILIVADVTGTSPEEQDVIHSLRHRAQAIGSGLRASEP